MPAARDADPVAPSDSARENQRGREGEEREEERRLFGIGTSLSVAHACKACSTARTVSLALSGCSGSGFAKLIVRAESRRYSFVRSSEC